MKDNFNYLGIDNQEVTKDIDVLSQQAELRDSQSVFSNSAELALKYLDKVGRIDEDFKNIVYFPIQQLNCFLSKKDHHYFSDIKLDSTKCTYFPTWYFMFLGNDFACDLTVNYLFEASQSKNYAEYIASQLVDLNEKSIYELDLDTSQVVYRFIWLRTFDNPVTIRIQKNKKEITLEAKIGKGAAGYDPKGLKKAKRIKLKNAKWEHFLSLINNSDFHIGQTALDIPQTDGAKWIIEYKCGVDYHLMETNSPDDEFKAACLYLLDLARLKIKPNRIY